MERGLCHNKLKVTHKDSNVFEAFVRVLKAGQAKYKESDGFDEDHIPFLNVIMPLRRGRDVVGLRSAITTGQLWYGTWEFLSEDPPIKVYDHLKEMGFRVQAYYKRPAVVGDGDEVGYYLTNTHEHRFWDQEDTDKVLNEIDVEGFGCLRSWSDDDGEHARVKRQKT